MNPIIPPAAVPTPSASPSQRIRVTISKPPILRALSVYILTSILISTSHIVFGRVFQSTSRGSDHFGIFVKSRYSPSTGVPCRLTPVIQEASLLSERTVFVLVHGANHISHELPLQEHFA